MKDELLQRDEKLMLEIKSGNMIAFDSLYRTYSKRLFNFAYTILKSREEAENIVQDVYLKLWENRLYIEKNSSVRSYLFSVAYNSTISVLRKKIKDNVYLEYLKSLQEPFEEPDLTFEYNELNDRLREIIDNLPERQKEVYLLHKEEGLTYKDIAQKLSISVNTVENHMARALKTVRLKLGSYSTVTLLFWFLFVK
jgi:RNA polymerase sigma-70 factor, ECF subfamily